LKVKNFSVLEQPSKDLLTCKIIKYAQSIFTKCLSQECFFARHINRENATRTFLSILQAKTFQNPSDLHSKQLHFWTQIVKLRPKLFLQNMQANNFKNVCNLAANGFVCGHINRENLFRTFSIILGEENVKNVSECHSKQLRFWMHKS